MPYEWFRLPIARLTFSNVFSGLLHNILYDHQTTIKFDGYNSLITLKTTDKGNIIRFAFILYDID